MKSSTLDKVTQSVEDFRTEVNMLFKEGSSEPATIGDIADLAKQTYYVLHDIEIALKEIAK